VTEVLRAAAGLQALCVGAGWPFCLIGGVAVQRWGEPRETIDVDATLLVDSRDEDRVVRTLLDAYAPRIPDAAAFARAQRVLLLRAPSGVGLDIALGSLPFEALVVERSTMFEFPQNIPLRTCSAEDLIVLKAFAAREKDWVDIDGVLIRQAGRIDWAHVRAQLQPLVELKEEPELLDELERRRAKLEG
jgi:hypothetical protein